MGRASLTSASFLKLEVSVPNHKRLLVLLALLQFGSAFGMALPTANVQRSEREAAPSAASGHARLMRFLMLPVEDESRLRGYRIAILAANGVDGFDLDVPRRFLAERGALVHVLVPRSNALGAARTLGAAAANAPTESEQKLLDKRFTVIEPFGEQHTIQFDRTVDEAQPCEYDLVYVPDLRAPADYDTKETSVAFLRQALAEGKPIFVMGSVSVMLLEAGLVDGQTAHAAAIATLASDSNIGEPALQGKSDVVHVGRDAFDMPRLMEELLTALRHGASTE